MSIKKPKYSSTRLRRSLVATAGRLARTQKSPDELLGELFYEVQLRQVYDDGKTFVDLVPKTRVRALKKEYALARQDPNFQLAEFVSRHFHALSSQIPDAAVPKHPSGLSAREHVSWLWPQLTRTTHKDRGSLFALPHPYIVPGGRFDEQFYWDSYFILLGLVADQQWKMLHGMIRNYIFMADKFGFIPTASRTYFTSRSQPPFFALMIPMLSMKRPKALVLAECLPTLFNEYQFWMNGRRRLQSLEGAGAYRRLVRMSDGTYLNRYFDDKHTPRPESHREDVETAGESGSELSEKVFLDLRAGAESGWDFSSRWFQDPREIKTIHTTDFAAIDLNCLLYISELTLADGYKTLLQPLQAKKYQARAAKRAAAIRRYMWSEAEQWFVDYDIKAGMVSSSVTLAGMFALYASVATPEQAASVAARLERDFLKPGGLVTTLVENGQQWDSPNGWAPLQWIAIVGLRNYGFHELADAIRLAWMSTVERVYAAHEKMVEKYDVVEPGNLGGGGEYPLQDGFGWTNGVYAALHDRLDETALR